MFLSSCTSIAVKESTYEALVEVTISSEGTPVSVKFLSPNLTLKQQQQVSSHVMKFVFNPAIQDGTPVESKLPLKLKMNNE